MEIEEERTTTGMDTKVKNEFLEKYAINMSKKALNGDYDKVFGRDEETLELIKILSRRRKNNCIVVGEPGVGKSAIVEHFVQQLISNDVPVGLLDKVVYSLDGASITAGTKYRGEMEERLKNLLTEAESDKNVILFMDEIHSIMDTNGGSLNIANIMKPYLTSGKLQVIGATTHDEYKQHFEKDGAMSRRFNKLTINEPSIEACNMILTNCVKSYEEFHGVSFEAKLLAKIPNLAKKYIKNRYLPDSAIDIIDEIGARLKVKRTSVNDKLRKLYSDKEDANIKKWELVKQRDYQGAGALKLEMDNIKVLIESEIDSLSNLEKLSITEDDVLGVISKISRVPLDKMKADGKDNIKKLQEVFDKELINQEEAKSKILKGLKRKVLGLSHPNKPLSLFFSGITGSGKTLTAKILADNFFEGSLIRFDLSEYSSDSDVNKFSGSPAGFIGYDAPTVLDKIRESPHSLILFDEVEKCSKVVMNLLLNIVDEGYATDSKGNHVDFTNTIIIFTSNLGAKDSEYVKAGFGGGTKSELKDTTMDAIKKHLSPELYNRIDEFVVFSKLRKEDMFSILDLEIEKFKKTMKEKSINVIIKDNVRDLIIDKHYDDKMGARPMRRGFQTMVIDKVVDFIIDSDNVKKLTVSVDKTNEIIIK